MRFANRRYGRVLGAAAVSVALLIGSSTPAQASTHRSLDHDLAAPGAQSVSYYISNDDDRSILVRTWVVDTTWDHHYCVYWRANVGYAEASHDPNSTSPTWQTFHGPRIRVCDQGVARVFRLNPEVVLGYAYDSAVRIRYQFQLCEDRPHRHDACVTWTSASLGT